MNGDPGAGGPASVFYDTMEIVDLAGLPITGGDNASAIHEEQIWSGLVGSTFGDVTIETFIWEFYLPGYTGDFRVQWDEIVHSSFDQLRVDSMVTESALPITPIPEPASVILLVLGSLAVSRRRQ
jgi:hypothetical protein